MIEPILQGYKGAELNFQERDKSKFLEFTIGTGANKNKISIIIVPVSERETGMTLEVESVDDPTILRNPDTTLKRIDILIEDILFHVMSALEIKDKAKVVEKGKTCPSCNKINDVSAKFCNECGFDFLESSPSVDLQQSQKPLEKPLLPSSMQTSKSSIPAEAPPQSDVEILDAKYPNKYECELCSMQCAYKSSFILLLKDISNLGEPFKRFDEFLQIKDIAIFSDYIYEYADDLLKKYSKFSRKELSSISYCVFSILSWHILESASRKVRLAFAEKVKEHITARFEREDPSRSAGELVTSKETPTITIKTGSLRIEENRCPYCYKKFDERTLNLKLKGYDVECSNCGTIL
ncbi:MAG: zinc ribbon domain-containing protein [Candidatus Helarchaeota archaeon]|nr:zinc ribbon domain-containing protein [Candidatus Helarchaeota archaeon]